MLQQKFPFQNDHIYVIIEHWKYRLISLRITNPNIRHNFVEFVLKSSPIILSPIRHSTYPSPALCDSVGRYAVGVAYSPHDLREDLPEPLSGLDREDITDARVQRRNRHAELGVGKVENLREDGGEQVAPRLLTKCQIGFKASAL